MAKTFTFSSPAPLCELCAMYFNTKYILTASNSSFILILVLLYVFSMPRRFLLSLFSFFSFICTPITCTFADTLQFGIVFYAFRLKNIWNIVYNVRIIGSVVDCCCLLYSNTAAVMEFQAVFREFCCSFLPTATYFHFLSALVNILFADKYFLFVVCFDAIWFYTFPFISFRIPFFFWIRAKFERIARHIIQRISTHFRFVSCAK